MGSCSLLPSWTESWPGYGAVCCKTEGLPIMWVDAPESGYHSLVVDGHWDGMAAGWATWSPTKTVDSEWVSGGGTYWAMRLQSRAECPSAKHNWHCRDGGVEW